MLRANLYKKFSKSNLPKAVDGAGGDPSKDPYLERGYLPTLFQMYEDSGMSAENFLKSDPLQYASEYRVPSLEGVGVDPKRNIYNPMYGSPGIYDAFFLDNLTYSPSSKQFAYPPISHNLNTVSIQSQENSSKVPRDRQTFFCEGDSCVESVPGVFQKREILDNDLNSSYNNFKNRPENFKNIYDKLKKDGYLSNPFSENSSLKVRGKKLESTPTTLKFDGNNKVQLPSKSSKTTPAVVTSTLPADINIAGQTNLTGNFPTGNPLTLKADVYTPKEGSLTGDFPTGNPLVLNTNTNNSQSNSSSPTRGTAKLPDLSGRSSLLEGMTPPATAPLPNLGVTTPGFLSTFGQGRNIIQGSPLGTTVQKDTNGNESSYAPGYGPKTTTQKIKTKSSTPLDYNSLFTLGLGAVNMGLGFNEDLRNRRDLQESIQNRDSKPVYDYNYMYGRTTTGGTEYQPTIKAEMGAKITKRQNTPYGVNNVEVEGGEFIQLPNFETEYAEGPSHEKGGVKTSLPENTRVYSDHLKPEGSKKTFAQLAKKYDISGFKQVLDSPFKKQVDKDTAAIMMTRNQKKLDELFNLQQSMNGNSNGEMRDGGIHNPGFQALPKAVQEKILANMEYGGYALPEYGVGGNTIVSNSDKSVLPTDLQPYAKWDSERKTWRVELPDNLESDKLRKIATAAEQFGIKNLVQSSNQRLSTSSKQYQGFYGGMKPQDYEKRIVEEKFGKDALKGLDEVGVRKKAFELLGIDSAKYDVNDAKKLYNDKKFRSEVLYPAFKSYLPAVDFRKDQGDDFKLGLEHYDAIKTPEAPKETPSTEKSFMPVTEKPATPEFPKGNTYGMQGTPPKGKYTKDPFNVGSLIPNVYGLAEAQTVYPYAIPEIDAPYLKPQTLNIQSQLQDIDNMATAANRSGADPLSTYLAGLDAKQKSFQAKQNYDAEGRSKADMFNAEANMKADMFNAEAFDKTYNDRLALARAYQSQEKSKQLANAVDKYADWDKSESSKKFLYDNFVTSFDLDRAKSDEMTVAPEAQPFYVGNPMQNILNQALSTTTNKSTKNTKKGKLGMSVKTTSLSKYKK